MKTSLILCSAAVMAAIVPATLFAQTVPVQQAVAEPVVATSASRTIPVTVPDPKALATPRPVSTATVAKIAPAAKKTVKRSTVKPAARRVVAKRAPSTAPTTVKTASASSSASDLDTAQSVLASLKATYRYLDGVTVSMGTTPGGYQAVSYYTKGRILISTKHTATISRILKHEIWHIIDWRDNGKIDWRESVPPHNASDYLK